MTLVHDSLKERTREIERLQGVITQIKAALVEHRSGDAIALCKAEERRRQNVTASSIKADGVA